MTAKGCVLKHWHGRSSPFWQWDKHVTDVAAAHDSAVANVFWFHRVFDLADPHDSHRLAAIMLGVLILVTLLAEERQYTPAERLGR